MRVRTLFVCLFLLATGAAVLHAGDVYIRDSDGKIVLGNDFLEIALDVGNTLKLLRVTDKRGSSPAVIDEGFCLQLDGGQEATAEAFRVVDRKVERIDGGGKRVTVMLRSASLGLAVRIAYELTRDNFFARRTFSVRSDGGGDLTLHRAELERLSTGADLQVGSGLGQPAFVGGRLFIGLEYPAAHNAVGNGRICLFHYPGKKLGRDFLELKSEAIGVAGKGSIEDAFSEYLRRIRIPPRSCVLYNSWYDIRRQEMSNEAFIECFEGFKRSLIDRYGVKLDTFVIDDGYQDMQSIWKTDKSIVPDDFHRLADHLKANGSVFGLWMPLTPTKRNLDLDWGRAQGYEVLDSGSNYCVSGPKFNRALREIMAFHVREFGLNYYKHDFNNFRCAAEGHAHLPRSEYGYEANVDAYIELLKYARKLNPDIFLNITGGMWLSPWWLMYADTVWRGGGDTGHEGGVPYIEVRDDTMTYVDGVIWNRVVKERRQFPPSAMMTHGICYGRRRMLGGKNEPFHRWTNHIVNYMAPGVMMIELYITPRILSAEQWAILGRTLAWAVAAQDVLAESKMTHGNPHKGEVYGYKHAKNGRLIWFLRNPSMNRQKVELAVAEALGGSPTLVELAYPYRLTLANNDKIQLDVPIFQTMVLEASRGKAADGIVIDGCRYAVASADGAQLSLDLIAEPGGKAKVHIKSPARIRRAVLDGAPQGSIRGARGSLDVSFPDSKTNCTVRDQSEDSGGNTNRIKVVVPPSMSEAVLGVLCEKVMSVVPMGRITLNGKPVKPKVVRGEGWRFHMIPLGKGVNELTYEIPMAERSRVPFAPKEMTVSSWLFGRQELPKRRLVLAFNGDAPRKRHLPTPFAHVDPQCIPIQKRRVVRTITPGAGARITAEDLAKAKAAKLHVNVFGVNGEEKYRNKPVLLNGVEIGVLPPNRRPLDHWQEQTMDIPKDKVSVIKEKNVVVFTNPTNDAFKIGDVGLAIRLADGTWAETNRSTQVRCSVGGWLHSEGEVFKGARSAPIELGFPLK